MIIENKICIVIPVYNNPKTIKNVIEESLASGFKLIVVDDGSDIEVNSLLKSHKNLMILRHPTNIGKGKAILTAATEAKKQHFESIIVIDGDGQHYPSEIQHIIPLLTSSNIVIGNRKFKDDVPFSSKFGRAFSNFWIFVETGRWLHDTQSGFRGYSLNILNLNLTHNHYDFEIEVIVKHLWANRPIQETDIEVYYPPKEERVSHFNKLKDNMRLTRIHTKLVSQNIMRLFKL